MCCSSVTCTILNQHTARVARSISEEMYSDPSRCDDQQKAESSSGTHSKPDSAHKDKDKKDKEKEERDEGKCVWICFGF